MPSVLHFHQESYSQDKTSSHYKPMKCDTEEKYPELNQEEKYDVSTDCSAGPKPVKMFPWRAL